MFKFEKKLDLLNGVSTAFASIRQKFKALRHNDEGIAAVEFAFLSPVMIALYFGLVEISMLIHSDKITSHATNVAGDLATQVTNMDSDDIEDVFEAALSTMALKPSQSGNVTMEILSYNMDASGTPQEIGRATLNGGYAGAAYDPQDIGPRLLTVGSGAVVARVQYDYDAVTYKFIESVTSLEETFILKPRSSADIPFSLNGAPGSFTCTSTGSMTVTCS